LYTYRSVANVNIGARIGHCRTHVDRQGIAARDIEAAAAL
jgi:hypothetical protein